MAAILTVLVTLFLCSVAEKDIRMVRDFRQYPVYEEFPIYWNVPSFMCLKHGINFSDYTQKYGIRANSGDQFRGENVSILYDPGSFPAMLKSSCGRTVERNGGIPQRGNLTLHLKLLEDVINQLVPKYFRGVAVLDFEAYRPNFRQNYNEQEIYTNMSREDVRQAHPQWDEKTIAKVAKMNFERSTRAFMESSLKLARYLRPHALWGYYGFPYCYNLRKDSGMNPTCSKQVQMENNQIQWLFDTSKALYPSIYMAKDPKIDVRKYVTGRMNEAVRMAARVAPMEVPKVSPYMWYKYFDSLDFVSQNDFYTAMETTRRYKWGGYVIWGSSNDFTSAEKCQAVLSYLKKVIGPSIEKVRKNAKREQMHDEHYFVPLEGEIVDMNNENNEYEYQNETQIIVEDTGPANYSAVPDVVIYTAFTPNGSQTIYQYDNRYEYAVVSPSPVTEVPKKLVVRGVSSGGSSSNKFSSTPWLVEYMKGFDNMLNRIVQRWSQRRK